MSPTLAFGLLLALVGIAGLSFGFYALLRGGRGSKGDSAQSPSAASTSPPGSGCS
jgi:hypothetical protein